MQYEEYLFLLSGKAPAVLLHFQDLPVLWLAWNRFSLPHKIHAPEGNFHVYNFFHPWNN